MRRYGLRDDQWERIRHLLPGREGSVGVTATDNRLFVEAVLFRFRARIPWRDLPERFGNGVAVHLRFSRWAKSGVWEKVFNHLAADADNEYAMIDSTIVRAHQHSAGVKKSRLRPSHRPLARRIEHKNPRTRRCTGQPHRVLFVGGQAHDLEGADELLPGMAAPTLIADRAFDADERVIAKLAEAGKDSGYPAQEKPQHRPGL
jgi:transposase